MDKPNSTLGLRHVALYVSDMPGALRFYKDILGMDIDWQPDEDNIYLTSGFDNLALHKAPDDFEAQEMQRLDHIGFMLKSLEDVDVWHEYLIEHKVPILKAPKTHRDKARSFYCQDPDGNVVQMIYHPNVT